MTLKGEIKDKKFQDLVFLIAGRGGNRQSYNVYDNPHDFIKVDLNMLQGS